MRALGWGIVAAALIAGPGLYDLVQDGSLSGSTALVRGGLVALACAVGFGFVASIAAGFRDDAKDAAAADAEVPAKPGTTPRV